jgi:O-antigen ligase
VNNVLAQRAPVRLPNLTLGALWYWAANFAILGSAYLSMYLNNAYPLLAIAVPLILLDRAYVVPILVFIAAIEGSFKVEDAASKAETYAIMLVLPFFAYDFVTNNKVKVPFKFSALYVLFGFFVIVGMFIYGMNQDKIAKLLVPLVHEKSGAAGVYIKMFMKIVKLVFFFLYLKVLINKDPKLFYRALTLIKDMAPYLIGLVLLNMSLYGTTTEKFDTMHFGESHHGDFSANMNALGVFLYVGIFEKKSTLFKRFVNMAGLGCLLFVIMNIASRNGLLNFLMLGLIAGSLSIWNMNWGAKVVTIVITMVLGGIAGYLFKDSPTIERFIYQTEEEGGGDRLAYWSAGITSLKEDPLLGLGGDDTASVYAVGKYSPEVEDHVMHNTFIEFLVEYGILGFIFYMVFQSTILYHAFKNFMFAIKYKEMLLAAPGICYFLSIFAGLFVSRVWESTLWYYMTLTFGIYILWRKPVEEAIKKRKMYLLHGLPDPVKYQKLIINNGSYK